MKTKYNSVLIVDDDPNQIHLISMYLKQIKINIKNAKNGRQALSILKDKKIDIVLTDYQMPEMDGETLISKIRKDLKLSIPIVMVSANDTQSDFSKFKNVKVLSKPFTQKQIEKIFI